jgi:hypothetical protein
MFASVIPQINLAITLEEQGANKLITRTKRLINNADAKAYDLGAMGV